MDRIEAYELVTEEMKKLAQTAPKILQDFQSDPIEFDVLGASGILYRVELAVQGISDQRFAILGKIHDNSSHQFRLLEERMEFDVNVNE